METLFSFLLAALVTYLFVRGYLKKLTTSQKPGVGRAPASAGAAPVALVPCPRCSKSIARGSTFCAYCGAAMAMWKVHSAAVRTAGGQDASKPKPVINASLCIGCGSCVTACPETGTLELINHKAILAHPDRCTSQAKCAEVCPTQAIAMASNGVLQTLRVPHVKENFETNVPGVFIVGELAGMGLIKSAINEGKLVIDHLHKRLQQLPEAPEDLLDVAIVGSGPAGLSASLAALQCGMRYVTLEQGEIASTIRQYPRQKFLMAEPIEMPLYGSLYIGDGTKESLLNVWETILHNTGVQVRTNERVERVQRNNIGFHVDTVKAQHHARFVVLAMGRRGTPRRLNVPGEDLAKVSYRLIEAETYENKNVLVVGGGDSAIEAALALSRSGKNRVALSYRGDNFQRARERNRQHLEEATKKGAIEILLQSNVSEIRADFVTLDFGARQQEMPNDYTFVMVGGESPEEFLRKTGIEIVEKSISL